MPITLAGVLLVIPTLVFPDLTQSLVGIPDWSLNWDTFSVALKLVSWLVSRQPDMSHSFNTYNIPYFELLLDTTDVALPEELSVVIRTRKTRKWQLFFDCVRI